MNIIDELLEQFNLDPSAEFNDLRDFSEDAANQYLQEAYTEATTGTTKRNVFQKLWDFIKKCLRWVVNLFPRFINWVKSLFSKNHTKSVDQIATECNINRTTVPARNTIGGKSNKVNIPIYSNPKSEIDMGKDITLAFKEFAASFEPDKQLVKLSINRYNAYDYGPVKGQPIPRAASVVNVVALMYRPDLADQLVQVSELMAEVVRSGGTESAKKRFIEADEAFNKAFSISINNSLQVSLDQMLQLQRKLNTIMKNIESVNDVDNNISSDADIIKRLNSFADFCARFQMSMNAFTSVLQDVYKIDAGYLNSVNNIDTLSAFVGKCIDAGIPPKYIGYNVYLISSKDLKGDGSNGNENNPIWGQSRLVLFPPNNTDVIYKIALSGWGVSSNKSEITLSQTFDKYHGSNLIAKTIGTTKNNTVITGERVSTSENISDSEISNLRSKIDSFIATNNIPFSITDIHSKNVGHNKQGKIVALDYAWGERRSTAS